MGRLRLLPRCAVIVFRCPVGKPNINHRCHTRPVFLPAFRDLCCLTIVDVLNTINSFNCESMLLPVAVPSASCNDQQKKHYVY